MSNFVTDLLGKRIRAVVPPQGCSGYVTVNGMPLVGCEGRSVLL